MHQLPDQPDLMTIPETTDLCDFKNRLDKAVKSDGTELIFNDGRDYAAMLFSTLFGNAQKTVDIYANNLRDELCLVDLYFNSLVNCLLNPSIRVRFLLSPHVSGTSKFRDFLQKNLPKFSNVEIRMGENVASEMYEELNDDAHFTIVDGKMYRMEYNIKEFKAMASFNSVSLSSDLTQSFDKIWNKLAPAR